MLTNQLVDFGVHRACLYINLDVRVIVKIVNFFRLFKQKTKLIKNTLVLYTLQYFLTMILIGNVEVFSLIEDKEVNLRNLFPPQNFLKQQMKL